MCSTSSGAAQNAQCMTSQYRESDKRADGSLCFHTLIILRSAASSRTHVLACCDVGASTVIYGLLSPPTGKPTGF